MFSSVWLHVFYAILWKQLINPWYNNILLNTMTITNTSHISLNMCSYIFLKLFSPTLCSDRHKRKNKIHKYDETKKLLSSNTRYEVEGHSFYKPIALPSSDVEIGKASDVIKPVSGKESCSSSLPVNWFWCLLSNGKISNHFECSQMFFPTLPLIARWTEYKAALIIDVCCWARSPSEMRRLSH